MSYSSDSLDIFTFKTWEKQFKMVQMSHTAHATTVCYVPPPLQYISVEYTLDFLGMDLKDTDIRDKTFFFFQVLKIM